MLVTAIDDRRRPSAYYTAEALIGKSYLLGDGRSDRVAERSRGVEENGDEMTAGHVRVSVR